MKDLKLKIRLAEIKYIPAAARILHEAYYSSIKSAKNALQLNIKQRTCFVALMDAKVVGVLMYTRNYSHYANYLEDIVVSKKHRRQGIARALLSKYIEVSRRQTPKKQKFALSSTDVSNKTSIKMHLNFGFTKLGVLKGLHYGKDEIFFKYELK